MFCNFIPIMVAFFAFVFHENCGKKIWEIKSCRKKTVELSNERMQKNKKSYFFCAAFCSLMN